MPAPIDPRYPHESRLNPLDRPDRRWRRTQRDLTAAGEHPPGSPASPGAT